METFRQTSRTELVHYLVILLEKKKSYDDRESSFTESHSDMQQRDSQIIRESQRKIERKITKIDNRWESSLSLVISTVYRNLTMLNNIEISNPSYENE